jgi:hypothetical protein
MAIGIYTELVRLTLPFKPAARNNRTILNQVSVSHDVTVFDILVAAI